MALIKLNNQSLTAVTSLPAAIPTGKVLQLTEVKDVDGFNVTATSYTANSQMELNFNSSQANTKVFILLTSGIRATNDQMEATVYGKVTSGGTYANLGVTTRSSFINMYPNSASNITDSGAGSLIHTFSNTSGQAIYLKVYIKCESGNKGNLTETQPSTLTAWEIAN